jgi:ABC-type sugar transport system permease subunit
MATEVEDGARAKVRQVRRRYRQADVTLPMISPTLFFNSVLACIAAFQTFELAFVGTKGGPAYATWIYGLHIYRTSFEFFDMGYGSTLAWILFILLSVFTYIQFRTSRSWVHYAGDARP